MGFVDVSMAFWDGFYSERALALWSLSVSVDVGMFRLFWEAVGIPGWEGDEDLGVGVF